jgi:hypothetical protein
MISRTFAMPSADTFSIPPIAVLLAKWLPISGVIVDPFARNSSYGTITNDLSPATTAQHHLPAEQFLKGIAPLSADAVLFDPPYSPRQISECYQSVGLKCSIEDTQGARLACGCKNEIARILRTGGIAICCGWNSMGLGKDRGFVMEEILLVTHGGSHNDTIVTVERKNQGTFGF